MADLTGIHNLQILRGMSNNNILLSCKPTGSTVDMYSKDDNSGRQQWKFTVVPGVSNTYNITVQQEENGEPKYLSCTKDGSKVDLYDKDDNSGRQKWVLEPVPNSPTCNTFYIKNLSGVSSDRIYLSCAKDGSKVDLYNKDDNSGRQRWQVQDVWVTD